MAYHVASLYERYHRPLLGVLTLAMAGSTYTAAHALMAKVAATTSTSPTTISAVSTTLALAVVLVVEAIQGDSAGLFANTAVMASVLSVIAGGILGVTTPHAFGSKAAEPVVVQPDAEQAVEADLDSVDDDDSDEPIGEH